jgi:hypothetical protein
MSVYLPAALRERLQDADGYRCAYCQTSVENTGQPLTVDHIIPQSLGGETTYENLCLACHRCNQTKGGAIAGTDPLTDDLTALFHPRRDRWNEHFAWDGAGARIVGLTATGRVTIVMLAMNDETIASARRRWVSVGWHPPSGPKARSNS